MFEDRTILVADDDIEMRALLCDWLVGAHFRADVVADGLALAERITRDWIEDPPAQRPVLIVADIRMPHLSGLTVLHALHTALPGLPFIVITAFGTAEIISEAKSLGASQVLLKPFDRAEFLSAVRTAIGPQSQAS